MGLKWEWDYCKRTKGVKLGGQTKIKIKNSVNWDEQTEKQWWCCHLSLYIWE